MFELLVKNATLPDGRSGIDIGCNKGEIVALENGISAEAKDTIDAKGWLVLPLSWIPISIWMQPYRSETRE